ncbi:MAG: phenylalanine--tRNA ligase beta subunit-related protein [Evtepia gabavorous]
MASLAQQYTLDTIAKHPHIAATRQAYKALGASPHEHRNAAEAMLRRVVKQAGLYHINNVVEVNNLISISSGYAIGSYDLTSSRARWSWPVPGGGPVRGHWQGESLHRPHARAHRRPGPLRQPQQQQPPGDDPARPPPGGLRPVRL